MIKAIETHYAGCRLRSRLEARWAVFFDHLGLQWEHEPEGFETSAGRYLPDFRVTPGGPAGPFWFEVKPPKTDWDPRHQALVNESDQRLILAQGMSRDYQSQYLNAPLVEERPNTWATPISFYVTSAGGALLTYSSSGPRDCPVIDAAYAAARSARFGD